MVPVPTATHLYRIVRVGARCAGALPLATGFVHDAWAKKKRKERNIPIRWLGSTKIAHCGPGRCAPHAAPVQAPPCRVRVVARPGVAAGDAPPPRHHRRGTK